MDLTGLDLARIKLIEQQLFNFLGRWNDKNYINSLTFCEREKLLNEIETLKFNYSTYCIKKPKNNYV